MMKTIHGYRPRSIERDQNLRSWPNHNCAWIHVQSRDLVFVISVSDGNGVPTLGLFFFTTPQPEQLKTRLKSLIEANHRDNAREN